MALYNSHEHLAHQGNFIWDIGLVTPNNCDGGASAAAPTSGSDPAVSGACPASAGEAATLFGGNANNWSVVPPNGWHYEGQVNLTGTEGWVIHTNQYTGGSGLLVGVSETTNGATAYCELGA
jgi:hypothetical protein